MNIQYFDLLQFTYFVAALLIAWKVKKNKVRYIPLGVLVIFTVLTPVNITPKNSTKRFVTSKPVIEKIEVKQKESFSESYEEDLKTLEKQSKEKLDEIIE